MQNIPTAEEFFNQIRPIIGDKNFTLDEKMSHIVSLSKKHTELHVQAALKAAAARYRWDEQHESDSPEFLEQTIINAYPLNQIK